MSWRHELDHFGHASRPSMDAYLHLFAWLLSRSIRAKSSRIADLWFCRQTQTCSIARINTYSLCLDRELRISLRVPISCLRASLWSSFLMSFLERPRFRSAIFYIGLISETRTWGSSNSSQECIGRILSLAEILWCNQVDLRRSDLRSGLGLNPGQPRSSAAQSIALPQHKWSPVWKSHSVMGFWSACGRLLCCLPRGMRPIISEGRLVFGAVRFHP